MTFPYNITALDMSDSSLNNRFKTCARKFELAKLYAHGRGEREDSLAADAGTCLHSGYQTFLATGDRRAGTWALMKNYPYRLQPRRMGERSIEALYATYLEMLAHPLDSRFQLATVNHKGKLLPAVEVPFRITFTNVSLSTERFIPIRYIGFIDAILFDTLTQEFVVVDIKTTRKPRSDYSVMFGRDPQCLPYAYVLEAIQQRPVTQLNVKYFIAYIDAMEPRVLSYDFPKSAIDVQEWGFNMAKDLRDIQMYASLGYFPRNGKACDTYQVCQYNNVCDYREHSAIENYLLLTYGPEKPGDLTGRPEFDPWFELDLAIPGLSEAA